MNVTHTSAQFLLFLAVCMPAAAQKQIGPDRHQAQSASAVSAALRADDTQIRSLQLRLKNCEEQLRQKSERVEDARQQAISAGIQGDGAGAFIDVYREQQKELESLQAELAPQIAQAQKLIAELTSKDSSNVSSLSGSGPAAQRHAQTTSKETGQPGILQARRGD